MAVLAWPGRPFSTVSIRWHFHTAFRSFAREFSNSAGTTDKVHPPYRSKEEAGAIACSMRLVLPSCAIPNLRQAEPGPDLPARFHGATSLENSPQRGEKSFSMIRCLRD